MIFVYLSKKISIPNSTKLYCVSWMKTSGYIATGGNQGLLKILKLPSNSNNNNASSITTTTTTTTMSTNLSMNQNLDGHSNVVHIAEWNECYQKLTTCDSNGLIIVWLTQSDSWYEDSTKGINQLWLVWHGVIMVVKLQSLMRMDKQLLVRLMGIVYGIKMLQWSGDSSLVLFGLIDGEIQSYDATGVFIYKLRMACIENVELETALNKDLRRITIVSMEWFTPLTQTNEYSNNYQVNFN
ncbi:hypothetical protein QQG55_56995 [Brugia pahangi]